jgi:hypothetical protein
MDDSRHNAALSGRESVILLNYKTACAVRRQNNGNVVHKIPNIFFFSPHSLHYNFLFIQKPLSCARRRRAFTFRQRGKKNYSSSSECEFFNLKLSWAHAERLLQPPEDHVCEHISISA